VLAASSAQWPNNEVPYELENAFTNEGRAIIAAVSLLLYTLHTVVSPTSIPLNSSQLVPKKYCEPANIFHCFFSNSCEVAQYDLSLRQNQPLPHSFCIVVQKSAELDQIVV
jgi:hypothetical protein